MPDTPCGSVEDVHADTTRRPAAWDAGRPAGADNQPPRDGQSPVEQRAFRALVRDVGAMPAHDVVQWALWPQTLTAWAREAGESAPMLFNCLARAKPYTRLRERLAERLEVPLPVLAHLIEAPRARPAARRMARAPGDALQASAWRVTGSDDDPLRLPAIRDGSNPIERRAVERVRQDLAAIPASMLVQLLLWPQTIAEWCSERRLRAPVVYSMLASTREYPSIRVTLAQRLGVTRAALDSVLDRPRRLPSALLPSLEAADDVAQEA